MTDEQVLRELMDAGSTRCRAAAPRSSPSACAEDLPRQVRTPIATRDPSHRARLGLRTNVTMLYGHIETMEERVDHMLRARALQDETGGFQAFIPLAFHPDNNQMRSCRRRRHRHAARARGVAADARQHSAHQGVLDCDRVELAQTRSGSASTTSTGPCRKRRSTTWPARDARGMTTASSTRSSARGREPLERDTLYNVVDSGETRPAERQA
jgi:aminodeoxyfutalosine synthase